MKCQIPQISWHGRDPILSIDFQPGNRNIRRLASGGTDSHVLIWYVTQQDNKSIKIECASDLSRHSKSVNVVRFSPNGELLVSGDDEGAMFVWQLKERDVSDPPKDDDNQNQEDWYPLKLLRGHLEDIYDVSWSADGNFLVSASMDNSAIMWDMNKFQKLHMFSESKGYVQGVTWDPLNAFVATIGSDRTLRVHNINSKKTVCRVKRAPWSVTTEKGSMKSRLFYDDTLKSYFRRLSFTPDGELLIVPSGILERDEAKSQNTTYVFSRHAPNKPAIHLPSGDKYTVAVRCNPLLYKLRGSKGDVDKENQQPKSMIDLPYRMVFAVAACDSILLYDTEQLLPFAYVSNIHYTHLTDLTWSHDGKILMACSTDGYCSILLFSDEELGEIYVPEPEPVIDKEEQEDDAKVVEPKVVNMSPLGKTIDAVNIVESSKPLSDKSETMSSAVENCKTPATDKPQVALSPAEASKLNRKPKLCTIKNFFASPKEGLKKISPKPSLPNPYVDLSKENKAVGKKLAAEVMSSPLTSKSDRQEKFSVFKSSSTLEEGMELDQNDASIEILFESKDSKTPDSIEKKPKCKTMLNFTEKIKSAENVLAKKHSEVEIANSNAVSSFSELLEENAAVEEVEDAENDWKLELSQDETPMETEPVASSCSDVKPAEAKTPESKPKRRISFVTLSKKPTMAPSK